ncbi:MAG: hypothetical protein IPM29_06780 [Planctomycetes bacterium]|nr:hypothetical protein [Planctomycetota bacterium]
MIAVDSTLGPDAVYELSLTTGAKTALGTLSSNTAIPGKLAYDAIGGKLSATANGTDSLFIIDVTNWDARLVGPFSVTSSVVMQGCELDLSTGTLYGMSSHAAASTASTSRRAPLHSSGSPGSGEEPRARATSVTTRPAT